MTGWCFGSLACVQEIKVRDMLQGLGYIWQCVCGHAIIRG